MGQVRLVGRHHHFAIGGDFDFAVAVPPVLQGDPPDLGVVLGRDHDLHGGRDESVPAGDLDAILGEHGFIGIRFGADGLVAGGPDLAAFRIAQVEILPVRIQDRILAPARDRQPLPPAETRSGRRHQHGVTTVGKDMRARDGLVGGGEPMQDRFRDGVHVERPRHFVRVGLGDGHALGNALLQQRIHRLDDGLCVEAFLHPPAHEHVSERDQHHSLMVGEIGFNDGGARAFLQSDLGVVDGLVKAVPAFRPLAAQAVQVLRGFPGATRAAKPVA